MPPRSRRRALLAASFLFTASTTLSDAFPTSEAAAAAAGSALTARGGGNGTDAGAGLRPRAAKAIRVQANPLTQEGIPYAYSIDASVGTKEFALQFDTGAFTLWVASSELDPDGYVVEPEKVVPCEGPVIAYEDGSELRGPVVKDTVTIGGESVEGFELTAATSSNKEYKSRNNARGFFSADLSTSTWLYAAKKAGVVPHNPFTVDLYPSGPGTIVLGELDESLAEGKLYSALAPDSARHWLIYSSTIGQEFLLDTGVTNIVLPYDLVREYYDQLGGDAGPSANDDGWWLIKCDRENVPSWSLNIDGEDFEVPGDAMRKPRMDEGDEWCWGSIKEMRGEVKRPLVGLAFITQVVVFYDGEYREISVARKKKKTTTTTTS